MYKLDPLPYDYSDLETFIDTKTLGLHHKKHQQTYLNKLNALLKKNNYMYNYSLVELLQHINEFNENDRENILFNLGGVINHNIYFRSISPKPSLPGPVLMGKIVKKYQSFEKFKDSFKKMALELKGSGYTFLVLDGNELNIINLKNQETPYSYNLIPLLGLDMWEHAYYLNYQINKENYIDNFFNIVDFSIASRVVN